MLVNCFLSKSWYFINWIKTLPRKEAIKQLSRRKKDVISFYLAQIRESDTMKLGEIINSRKTLHDDVV